MGHVHHRGSVLLVSLFLLIVLTVLAISAINTSTTGLRITGNMQSQHFADAAVQQAMDNLLSNSNNFNFPTVMNPTVNGLTVTLTRPECRRTQAAGGYSRKMSSNTVAMPQDTEWQVTGTATDTLTGAQASVTQGVRIRLTAGNCNGI